MLKRLHLAILAILIASISSAQLSFASGKCSQVLITDNHHAFEFLLKFRKDYLPFQAQRLKRPIDNQDLYLLEQSYQRGGLENPIEMGLVELLDKNGKVLDQSIQQGVYRSVYGQNTTALDLLVRNHHRLEQIHTVRKRHTHPIEIYPTIIANAFSDGDMTNDQRLRQTLDGSEYYKKIRLESWIVFINFDLQTHDPVELVPRDAKTRGYLVQ